MDKKLAVTESITISAPVSKVWDALINPEIIKKYLFGTTVETDWKVGSPIVYRGEWEGKTYEDKGVVLKFEPEKLLQSTYWSSMSGLDDIPENYNTVTYALALENNKTKLSVTQDNIDSEKSKDHSGENWKMVLEAIKKICEN